MEIEKKGNKNGIWEEEKNGLHKAPINLYILFLISWA